MQRLEIIDAPNPDYQEEPETEPPAKKSKADDGMPIALSVAGPSVAVVLTKPTPGTKRPH